MAMMRAGAYSEKFQKLEKERVNHLKEQDKVKRGKAQLFSKQTAQRQKALEDKKKAMVAAEEDRRKKVLEERREAQKAATKRFRSALGRIKSTSTKGQGITATKTSTGQDFLEYYLPSKPKPSVSSQISEGGQERRALGKDVEIKLKPKNGYHLPRKNGMQHRTPSLDDVMEKIKGQKSVAVKQESAAAVSHGRIIYHQKVPNVFLEQSQSMGKRSSSDPTLSSPRNASHNNAEKGASRALLDLGKYTSDENIVFRSMPASQATTKTTLEEDLRITSPDSSSGSESLLSNPPQTPDLNDSLDTPKNGTVFTIGGEKLAVSEKDVSTNVASSAATHPVYVCENNVTDSLDSIEDQQTPKPKQSHSAPVSQHSRQQIELPQQKVKEKPKVVGILKKPMSSKGPLRAKRTGFSKAKRVSFSDILETSYSTSTPRKGSPDTGSIDPAKLELWKRVLPNGVTTQYLPNSAFTPKMKVSLSSKASQSPSTPQGISVRIPVATSETQSQPDSLNNSETPVKVPTRSEPSTPVQPHVSTASVGLNGVVPTSELSEEPLNNNSQASAHNEHKKQIMLENTPTDDEINNLWDQIRNALEDNQKVFVPPQVFNFRVHHPSRQEHSSTANSYASNGLASTHKEDQRNSHRNTSADRIYSRPIDTPTQRGTQKQPNLSRPIRYQNNFSPQSAPLLSRRSHGHAVTYPVASRAKPVQMSSTEPDASRTTGSRKGPTALSVEEKRLMLSIENLNQKIKDHMKRHPNVAKFQSPVSPEPPDFTELHPHPPLTPPQMHRVSSKPPHPPHTINGHTYNSSKPRPRRPPKTVPLTMNTSQSGGDYNTVRTRPPQRRTMFYNT